MRARYNAGQEHGLPRKGKTGCELSIYSFPIMEGKGRDPRVMGGTPQLNPRPVGLLSPITRIKGATPWNGVRIFIFDCDSNHKRYNNRFTNTTTYSVQSEYRAL